MDAIKRFKYKNTLFLGIFILIITLFLSACGESAKPVDEIKDVTVVNKFIKNGYRNTQTFYVTVEKEKQTATFKITANQYDMLEKDSVISGKYYNNGKLSSIKFSVFK